MSSPASLPAKAKLAIRELKVCYGSACALKGITLNVNASEILTIIGPANSGKSSLLLAINRMIERVPEATVKGSILLDNQTVQDIEDVQELRRRIGMVFATPIPLPMSIRDNVLFGIRMKRRLSRSDADEVVESSLKAAFLWEEVKDRLYLSAVRLSGGQQQRLCIARTLAVKPEVIMFDEPCSGLDPISTAQVEEALRELKKQQTIILVTNNTKQAARVGDRTAFLLMGDLIEIAPTGQLFTNARHEKTEAFITGKFG